MTLRYVQVTQQDLQCEFHLARQNTVQLHHIPTLPVPIRLSSPDLTGTRHALAATRHLLEMCRRQLDDEKIRRKLRRLDRRLRRVAAELDQPATSEK